MKSKLNRKNLINIYCYNGIHELEFYVDGKYVSIKNIKKESQKALGASYFHNDEVIEEIKENANESDIEIVEMIIW